MHEFLTHRFQFSNSPPSQTFLDICVNFHQPRNQRPKYALKTNKQRNRTESKTKTIRCFLFRFVSSTSPASHAQQHSLLLLDLDQLVVVSANLDNLTIASSAAYSDSVVVGHRSRRSSSSSSTCSSPHSIHPPSINQLLPPHHSLSKIATNSTLRHATNIPCDGSSAVCIDTALDANTLRRGLFDHFLDSSKCGDGRNNFFVYL